MKPSPGFLSACRRAVIPSLICLAGTASAQLYWDTDGATPGSATSSTPVWGVTNAWSTDSTGSTATSGYVQGSDAIFAAGTNGVGTYSLKINGTQSANSLTFEEGTVTVSATDTAGNTSAGAASLTIGAGGVTMANGLHGQLFFGASLGNITLSADQSWLNNTITDSGLGTTARSLRIASNLVGNATAGNTTTWTLGGTSTGAANVEGVIGDGSGGGKLALTKAGASNLTLNGTAANTYTGLTTVSGGTLTLGKTDNVTAIAGDIQVTSGTLTWSTNNQVADAASISASGGSVNFNGRTETIANLTVGSANVTTGTGSATITGSTNITSGGATRLTVNSGGSFTTNSLTLGGTAFAIGGATGGNILIGGNSATVTRLNIGSGGLTMTGQVIQFNQTNSGQAGSEIALGGDFTGSGTNTIGYGTTAGNLASAVNLGNATRTFNLTGTTSIGVTVSGAGAGLTKTGSGTLVLSGDNTYTGATSVNTGILNIRHAKALGTTAGTTTVAGGAALQMQGGIKVEGEALTITGTSSGSTNNAGLVNVSGDNEWTGNIAVDVTSGQNARIAMNGGTLKISGNVAISDASSGTGLVLTGNTGTGTISGVVSGTGANQNIIKNGTSTWVLSGTNTYTGTTRIDGGILSVSSVANNLGTSTGAINLGEGTTTGTLQYTGSGETVTRGFVLRSVDTITPGGGVIDQSGTGNFLISGAITSNASTLGKTLTLQGSTSGTGQITGNISNGTGSATSVAKAGTGTWTLSGTAKSYSGSTTVTGGQLNISTSLTNTSALNISNGTLALGAANLINDIANVNLGPNGSLVTAIGAETVGALAVTGSSTLDLSLGASLATFANSSSQDWTGGLLTILGWNGNTAGGGAEQVIFGNDATGLTSTQLGQVQFSLADGLYSSKILANGEIVPDALIPEPSSAALALLGTAGLLVRRKRRGAI